MDDAKDAARYRWLLSHTRYVKATWLRDPLVGVKRLSIQVDRLVHQEARTWYDLNSIIDEAMAAPAPESASPKPSP